MDVCTNVLLQRNLIELASQNKAGLAFHFISNVTDRARSMHDAKKSLTSTNIVHSLRSAFEILRKALARKFEKYSCFFRLR